MNIRHLLCDTIDTPSELPAGWIAHKPSTQSGSHHSTLSPTRTSSLGKRRIETTTSGTGRLTDVPQTASASTLHDRLPTSSNLSARPISLEASSCLVRLLNTEAPTFTSPHPRQGTSFLSEATSKRQRLDTKTNDVKEEVDQIRNELLQIRRLLSPLLERVEKLKEKAPKPDKDRTKGNLNVHNSPIENPFSNQESLRREIEFIRAQLLKIVQLSQSSAERIDRLDQLLAT